MGGTSELFAGVLGRAVGRGVADQAVRGIMTPEAESDPAPTELSHHVPDEADLRAIDAFLGAGWQIICQNTPSSIRTASMTQQGLKGGKTYEGYGLTIEAAIVMAVGRNQNNRGGLFRPTVQLKKRHSIGAPVPRSSLDAREGSSTVVIRRASSEDPVVIKVGEEFYPGDSFRAAAADFASKNPSPYSP